MQTVTVLSEEANFADGDRLVLSWVVELDSDRGADLFAQDVVPVLGAGQRDALVSPGAVATESQEAHVGRDQIRVQVL